MSVDVEVSITIGWSLAEVADFASDPSNAPTWYRRISTATWRTEPPIRIGSQIDFEARFLGRELAYTYEIVELVAGERLCMRTAEGPFPMTTEYTWRPDGDAATVMSLRKHGKPLGFSRIVAPFVARAMRRATTGDLAQLQGILEARDN